MERATDLSGRYWAMKETDLRRLKSQKLLRIMRIERSWIGYSQLQEIRKLRSHLKWIDAVLAARDAQAPLFE